MSSSAITTYIGFLRGINVGGHMVKMAELKKTLESIGLENIATVLASGNISFESKEKNKITLETLIEKSLKIKFGFEIPVVLRKQSDIQKLVKSNPFKEINITPKTRLYITFLKSKVKSKLKIPFKTSNMEFQILKANLTEVISVLELVEGSRTVDLMSIIEKEFGKMVTTRNWNTVCKMLPK